MYTHFKSEMSLLAKFSTVVVKMMLENIVKSPAIPESAIRKILFDRIRILLSYFKNCLILLIITVFLFNSKSKITHMTIFISETPKHLYPYICI